MIKKFEFSIIRWLAGFLAGHFPDEKRKNLNLFLLSNDLHALKPEINKYNNFVNLSLHSRYRNV